jgi:outer membrane lipoprotein SlyB
MSRFTPSIALLGTLALGACTVAPPSGPSSMALPGKDKTFEAFQQDDASCRQYATVQTGGATPADAANQSMLGSAAIGTAVGAAAGAALGAAAGNPGLGAAAGAGAGLLTGTAVGSNNAAASGASVQRRYDMAYNQCMYGHGNSVPTQPAAVAAYPAYPPPYGYPYPAYYPYPYYGYAYPGYVGVGVGFGRHW